MVLETLLYKHFHYLVRKNTYQNNIKQSQQNNNNEEGGKGAHKEADSNNNKSKETNKIKLKILQLNINGLRSKIIELEKLVEEKKPDVICIQETKL